MKDLILIVDDDEQLADVLSVSLESEGYEVHACATGSRALEAAREHSYSLILLDIRLGTENGLELLPRLREFAPNVPVLMITAHGNVESAVWAFTLGANGYITKPFREGEFMEQIARAIDNYRLRREIRAQQARSEPEDIRSLIRTRDPRMLALLKHISVAANTSSNVMITGDSGTGKELVARALHMFGNRRNKPFIALNCAALPETLLESELFGYMRGAFTDAKESKPGLFARADGGTLFLDEVGDAPLSIQAKLLRVIQEKEFTPLGALRPIKIDVRLVSATHRNIKEAIAQGRFRQDLFYRLHVIPIHVPPLRERPKDILFLASIFANKLAAEMHTSFDSFTHAAIQELESYEWPGNVRELQNRVEYAIVTSQGGKLTRRNLFPELPPMEDENTAPAEEPAPSAAPATPGRTEEALPSYSDAKKDFEKNYLLRLLQLAGGNITKAAKLAEKSRTEVYGLLRKHGFDSSQFKRTGGS